MEDTAEGTTVTKRQVLIARAYRVVNVDQCQGPGIDRFP